MSTKIFQLNLLLNIDRNLKDPNLGNSKKLEINLLPRNVFFLLGTDFLNFCQRKRICKKVGRKVVTDDLL